jgi:DNA-binding GntR family transcriptional regulator
MFLKAESAQIASQLRHRICMMDASSAETTLHEGSIATEFGVSRTPIRQVLQKLAYERLVETRSGVGTIVAPLREGQRDRDLAVLSQLFLAAARCAEGVEGPRDLPQRLAAIRDSAPYADQDAQGYLHLRAEFLEVTSDAVPDRILGDAVRAAHWRALRWRMAEQAWTDPEAFAAFDRDLETAADLARSGSLAEFLTFLGERDL